MGIRIHKRLGFTVIAPKWEDPEIWSEMTLVDLKKGLSIDCILELMMDLNYSKIDLNAKIENYIKVVELEHQKNQCLYIFIPPHLVNEWSRYNDIIDHLEADPYDANPKIKYIHERILPYVNPMVVSKTGLALDYTQADRIRLLPLSRFDQMDKSIKISLEALGIDFSQPLANQIHMEAPKVIQELAKHAGIVDIKLLKLAICTYWE